MSAAELEAVRQVVREELRRCGLRPVLPAGPGAWVWSEARDEWVEVLASAPGPTPVSQESL